MNSRPGHKQESFDREFSNLPSSTPNITIGNINGNININLIQDLNRGSYRRVNLLNSERNNILYNSAVSRTKL